jgi:hypothetical protein
MLGRVEDGVQTKRKWWARCEGCEDRQFEFTGQMEMTVVVT